MLWQNFQNTIADWFKDWSGLAHVRWEGGNAEGPPYPYGILSVLSDRTVGQDELTYVLDPLGSGLLIPEISGLRQIVVTCKVVTNTNKPEGHARAYASEAKDSLSEPEVIALFSANAISIVDTSPTVGADSKRNLGIVSIAAFDLRLEATISRVSTSTNYIKTARVEGEIQLPDHSIEFGPDTYGDT